MSSLVVIGAQWGDEGKGKLVDYLTANADYVVRFQGGNNAGHTIVVDGKKTKLSLVPSGILREGVRCMLGAGTVINPQVLLQEIAGLEAAAVKVTPERLVIDENAHLILDYHVALDKTREELKGKEKIGTTGRGIGPAYEDRARRCGIRFGQLFELDELRQQLKQNFEEKQATLQYVLKSEAKLDFEAQWQACLGYAEKLKSFVGNVSLELDTALRAEKRVVFEGAQGALLDQSFGALPFVTSSHTTSGGVCIGAGIAPQRIDYVLGVAKAYATRVGSGPFPTELFDKTGDLVRERGGEFGTVTGRPRRVGWFDAVALKKALRLNGFNSLAITKLDVLSGIEKIKVCVKYTLNGKELTDVPALASHYDKVEPHYVEFEGWSEDLSGIRKWHKLPKSVRFYLSSLAEIVGCPISLVSVGAEREDTIFTSNAQFVQNFMGT